MPGSSAAVTAAADAPRKLHILADAKGADLRECGRAGMAQLSVRLHAHMAGAFLDWLQQVGERTGRRSSR